MGRRQSERLRTGRFLSAVDRGLYRVLAASFPLNSGIDDSFTSSDAGSLDPVHVAILIVGPPVAHTFSMDTGHVLVVLFEESAAMEEHGLIPAVPVKMHDVREAVGSSDVLVRRRIWTQVQ